MIRLILYVKNLYNWLCEWLSETDIKQALLYILLIMMLFYIASILTGWLSVACVVIAILYGGFILWDNFGKKIIDKLLKKHKEEQEN